MTTMSMATTANMNDEDEKDTNDTSVATGTSNASTAAAPTKKPRARMGAFDADWLFSTQADNPLITIRCGEEDKSFVVLKSILTRNSDFFEKCLNKPWAESSSSTVHLPDIESETMELYLTLTTRQALMDTASKDGTLVRKRDFLRPCCLPDHLRLYKACAYLQNKEFAKGVQEMFFEYMGNHPIPKTEDGWEPYFRAFATAFDVLEPGDTTQRRLQRRIVKAFCARVSSEVYFKHCKVLRERQAFLFEVTQQFALNAMWKDASTKAKADKHMTQRMKLDDDSEAEG